MITLNRVAKYTNAQITSIVTTYARWRHPRVKRHRCSRFRIAPNFTLSVKPLSAYKRNGDPSIQLFQYFIGVSLLICIDSCRYQVTINHVIPFLYLHIGKRVLQCYYGKPFSDLPKTPVLLLFLFQKEDTKML